MLIDVKKLNLFRALALSLVLILCVSCTRSQNSSSVTIDIPGVSNFSQSPGIMGTPVLKHIIINAHLPGKPTVLWAWDQSQPPASPRPIPTQATLLIDKAPGVIFQALMVYEDSDTAAISLKYGDTTKDLSAETETVPIVLSTVGGGSPKEYTIAGRYISGVHGTGICVNADSGYCGPTGTLRIQFQPPESKPKMLIKRTSMLNGWFSVFGIDGGDALFTYTLEESGLDILKDVRAFVNGANTITPSIAAAPHRIHIDSPLHYEEQEPGGTRKARPARRIIYGFFSSNTDIENTLISNTHKVCYYDSAAVNIPRLFDDPNTGSPIQFLHSAAVDPFIRRAAGGVATLGICTDALELKTDLKVVPQRFLNGVEEGWYSFNSFFANQFDVGFNGKKISSQHFKDTNNLILKWNKIPGVNQGPSGIDGIDFMLNKAPALEEYHDFTCAQLLPLNFIIARSVPATETTVAISNIEKKDLHVAKLVACPYKNTTAGKVYYGSADELRLADGPMQNGILSIEKLTTGIPNNNFKVGNCEPLQVTYRDWKGLPIVAPAGGITGLTAATTYGKLYSTNGCGAPLTSFSIPPGNSTATIYIQSFVPGILSIQADHSGGQYESKPFQAAITTAGSIAPNSTAVGLYPGTADTTPGKCIPLEVSLHDPNNFLTYVASDQQITYTTDHSGFLYSDSNCSIVIPKNTPSEALLFKYNLTIPNSEAYKKVYYKGVVADVGQIDLLSLSNGFGTATSSIAVRAPTFAKFKIKTGTNTTLQNGCALAYLEAVNNEGLPVKMAAASNITLSETTNLTVIHTESTCGAAGVASQSVYFPQNSTTSELFYINRGANITLTFGAVIGASSNLLDYDVLELKPASIATNDNANNPIATITNNLCTGVKIEARDSGATPITVSDNYEVYLYWDGNNDLVKIYSDAGCTIAAPRNSVSIPRGSSQSNMIYVKAVSTVSGNIFAKLRVKDDLNFIVSPSITVNVP